MAGTLASGSVSRVARTSAAATMTSAMVSEYAWSGRTIAPRDSQWKAWLPFCNAEGQIPLPVTEGHV